MPKIIEVRKTPNIKVNLSRKRKISQSDTESVARVDEPESVTVPVADYDTNNDIGKTSFFNINLYKKLFTIELI